MADHRLPLRVGDMHRFAAALAAALGAGPPASLPAAVPQPWFDALVRDLQQHIGTSVVIPGLGQSPEVYALVHVINAALGAVGKTVTYIEPVATTPVDETASLRDLVQAMSAGQVQTLLILGGNPVYTAPTDLAFDKQMAKVGLCTHLGLYEDETSVLCQWHLPESHYLESWSDARAYDGTASIVQPLISPLYSSLSAPEFLARLLGDAQVTGYDLVRAVWRPQASGSFDSYWNSALNDGVLPNTASPAVSRSLAEGVSASLAPSVPAVAGDIEVAFQPDPAVFDGRFANNPWLQEWPRPITQLTWDNAALMAPATAARLDLESDDLVDLSWQGRSLSVPIFIVPGHAPDSITLHLGYGRPRAGQVGTGVGFNAYALRTAGAPWLVSGVQVRRLDQEYALAVTRDHHLIEGRDLLRVGTLAEYQANPNFAHGETQAPPTLYPTVDYPGERWGMVIDLNACIGCNACVLACQAENNIPVVGKDQVTKGREMHWLRVDSYFFGQPDNPEVHFQPVPCMQCERAPCEPVCPVDATVHSSDGLNDMVYNRCVGTRYCSNNCPYKVRRFNFLQYEDANAAGPRAMQRNPDVTVRTRGVMEKCTYCVQRIRAAQSAAHAQGRPVQEGEVVTACQGACPTQAITFGDLRQPDSAVARLHALPRNYAMLEELGTLPRTTYLAAVRNPNPALG
jgi:Fe-S-cluster-containing dehydrogenase component